MVKKINEKELENIILESVKSVLINEDLENEGFFGRMAGGLKGMGNAIRGEYNKAKTGMQNGNLSNAYKGQSFGNRLGAAKNMIKAQANQGDSVQELTKLQDLLYKLDINGYFNKATKPYADQLYKALQTQMNSGENLQVKGAYKRGYGQSMPQSQNTPPMVGMGGRNRSYDPNGFGTGAAQ